MNQLVVTITQHAPAIIAGDRASYRFLEFFTAQIRNSEHASRTVRTGIRQERVHC